MSESPHLGLGYLAPAQAQKHVTVNEAFRRLDALVQLGVVDRDRTAPPAGPGEGDRHLVAPGATGAWAGQDGRIAAFLDGVWEFIAPKPGWLAYVEAEGVLLAYVGGVWVGALGALASLDGLARLGVNAEADDDNRLAVASAAALFTHAGADVRLKLNKALAADVASLLLQTGYGGRAELGLIGSDAFALKVSPDGASWSVALEAEPGTGAVSFPRSPQRAQADVFTADGVWTKPDWAGRVVVTLVGGGGGGGGAASGNTGFPRAGGAGGGAGAVVTETFLGEEITAACSVVVGLGGAGGAGVAVGVTAGGGSGVAGAASAFLLNGSGPEAQALVAPGGGLGGGGGTTTSTAGTGGSGLSGPSNAGGPGSSGAAGIAAVSTAMPVGPGGGGGGAGLSTATTSGGFGGGAGGAGYAVGGTARQATGGAAAAAGGAGGHGGDRAFARGMGGGGGGGGSHAVTAGGHGGDGGAPGGGGGGGGAGRTTGGSGSGGRGGDGICVILSYAM
ncbi:DUF2793 domain-containing protein [Methylopila turkensis]|uniref:DUF2793 domain-containing protein n=1 Tax=Methylopila turkensis TaxID=1437816 RepID=A0A9W6JPK4_9HYPH|nr:DUF2793 domain-containing protein [Methylopila turkensis]GLK81436.1 hypothetical protein GCM10008174_31770 [Methylopila turkensis]